MATPSPNVITALQSLATADHAAPAYVVGAAIVKSAAARGERTVGQRGARYIGPGAIASPVLRSLNARGWAQPVAREDGMTGTAWVITPAGRAALVEWDPPLVL